MEKQQFKILIDASPQKVWSTLWEDATYRLWTAAFAEGSRADTDWQKGSKVLFHDGNGNGMVATIVENIPNEFMSIKHLGEVKQGVEVAASTKQSDWVGALENYILTPIGEKTELNVEMDIAGDFLEYFQAAWPKALQRLKDLAERN